jgi:hypothetical protein
MRITIFLLIVLTTVLVCCTQTTQEAPQNIAAPATGYQPPLKQVNVPYSEYSIDARQGDTLFYHTGSIIVLPPNAFIDAQGQVINGTVTLRYRELLDPVDFYFSGIPMVYDSSGKQHMFESFGMNEILAYKDGVPLRVNPASKPTIHMAAQNNSPAPNLYFFDTTIGQWKYSGKPTVTGLPSASVLSTTTTTALGGHEIVAPVKPEKANGKSPIIEVVVDPASFKELMAYDNLRFQLEASETTFNPADTAIEWSDVQLQRGAANGTYIVTFSNPNKTVSYRARPVLQGDDYTKAVKVFDEQIKQYQKQKTARQAQEKVDRAQYLKDSIAFVIREGENEEIKRFNVLVEARNKEIDRQNAIVEKRRQEIADRIVASRFLRSFTIDGFGFWNCDRLSEAAFSTITCRWQDKNGQLLELSNIAVLHAGTNSITTYPDNRVQVSKQNNNVIMGVYNGNIAYAKYNGAMEIASADSVLPIKMTILPTEGKGYRAIKAMLQQ